MDFSQTDSSGTDDDLPPTHQNRYERNVRVVANGRSAVAGSSSYPRMHNNDMGTEIYHIEREAYYHVLRAFNAQSDAITWDTESLLTNLRKELRVSDEEHRELLPRVNNDETIWRIREWRKTNEIHSGGPSSFQPVHESVPSPTISASRKKQKTGQSAGSLSVGPPPPALHPPPMQPPSSSLKRCLPTGGRGKKHKAMPYPPTASAGRPRNSNHSSAFGANEPAEASNSDSLIGRKVWTRWPEDNNFYEAVIKDYKEGRHALVYDFNTPDEAWEWVPLKDISPEDIRWEGDDPGISQSGRTGQGRGSKNLSVSGGDPSGVGRGHDSFKGLTKKDTFLPQNGIGRKGSGNLELLHTDTLIKEVEKVFSGTHLDPAEVEKAKKVLKDHERALIEAISRLEVPSDGESDGGNNRFSQAPSTDRDQGWGKRQYDGMRGGVRPPGCDKSRHAKLLEA